MLTDFNDFQALFAFLGGSRIESAWISSSEKCWCSLTLLEMSIGAGLSVLTYVSCVEVASSWWVSGQCGNLYYDKFECEQHMADLFFWCWIDQVGSSDQSGGDVMTPCGGVCSGKECLWCRVNFVYIIPAIAVLLIHASCTIMAEQFGHAECYRIGPCLQPWHKELVHVHWWCWWILILKKDL